MRYMILMLVVIAAVSICTARSFNATHSHSRSPAPKAEPVGNRTANGTCIPGQSC